MIATLSGNIVYKMIIMNEKITINEQKNKCLGNIYLCDFALLGEATGSYGDYRTYDSIHFYNGTLGDRFKFYLI